MEESTQQSQDKPAHPLNVLVCGAGIAGPAVAFFLARAGHSVTILERAPELRASGQSIDVRGHGITVLQRMGKEVEEKIRAKTSNEEGFMFVDKNDRAIATFPVEEGAEFTGEIEILRGELAIELFEAARKLGGVEVVFGKHVTALTDRDDRVDVGVSGGWPGDKNDAEATRSFNLVIAADGWASTTRALAFGDEASNAAIRSLGQWTGWCTIPYAKTDVPWARWYNATRGRMILMRPDNDKYTRVALSTMTRAPELEKRLPQLLKESSEEQKRFFQQLFADAGWQAERVVQGMEDTDDFYVQQIAQVHMDSWSKGRIVLVGDTAACPSPISGMGTTVALVGAYVLAGEIINNCSNLPTAFKSYEDKMRPFVDIAQKIAPGAPGIANPETEWGIWLFNCFMSFVSWTKIYKLFGASFSPPASALDLPDYQI